MSGYGINFGKGCEFVGLRPKRDADGDFTSNIETPCRRATDNSKRLCPRHELLEKKQPFRWQCIDCSRRYRKMPSQCQCGTVDFQELAVEWE